MFTSSRKEESRYVYVVVHVDASRSVEYSEVDNIDIWENSSLLLKHGDGAITLFKEYEYVEYKMRKIN
jgi:hypothetical protein